MSESTFPFAPGDEAPAFEDEAPSSRRNLVALGALAAVLLAGGGFFLLSGGDESADDLAFTPKKKPTVAAAAPAAKPNAVKLPAASTVALGRNPFKALYIQPAAAPAPTGPTTGGPTTGGTVPTAPTTPTTTTGGTPIVVTIPGGTPTGSGSGGTPTTAPRPAPKEHKLVLTRVYGAGKDLSAVFTVDGKQMTARVGSTFGPTAEIKLLSLHEGPEAAQWTAVLQVGDGEPFDVVPGVPAYVR